MRGILFGLSFVCLIIEFLPPLGTTPRRSRTLLKGREYFLPTSLGLKA